MDEERAQASQVLWINETEYYFVCSECYQTYTTGLTRTGRELSKSFHQAIDKVTEQQIDCELCEYDIQEFTRQVRKDELSFDELPEEIEGEVFRSLRTDREMELFDIESLEERKEQAENELLEELGLEEPPRSFFDKQLYERRQDQQNHLNQMKETTEQISESSDKLISYQYGRVLADYKIAMDTDLWRITQSGVMGELFGYLPMGGFLQSFVESVIENYALSKDAAHNSEIIFENLDEITRNLGSEHRKKLEQADSDEEIGRLLMAMYIGHHRGLKQAFN